ncbi:hypothetical protein ACSLVK_16385 [Photorhabdus tasmaniensis]|nr:hypothetical protein [Photorhabdus tasmaniensis]
MKYIKRRYRAALFFIRHFSEVMGIHRQANQTSINTHQTEQFRASV